MSCLTRANWSVICPLVCRISYASLCSRLLYYWLIVARCYWFRFFNGRVLLMERTDDRPCVSHIHACFVYKGVLLLLLDATVHFVTKVGTADIVAQTCYFGIVRVSSCAPVVGDRSGSSRILWLIILLFWDRWCRWGAAHKLLQQDISQL